MWDKKIFPQANMVQDARATAILGTCKSAGDRVFESRRPHHLLFDRSQRNEKRKRDFFYPP